eukprot:4700010-Amphidinium_carterae.1
MKGSPTTSSLSSAHAHTGAQPRWLRWLDSTVLRTVLCSLFASVRLPHTLPLAACFLLAARSAQATKLGRRHRPGSVSAESHKAAWGLPACGLLNL